MSAVLDAQREAEWLQHVWSSGLPRLVLDRLEALQAALNDLERLRSGDEEAWHAIEDAAKQVRVTASGAQLKLPDAPTPRSTAIHDLLARQYNTAIAAATSIEYGLETPQEYLESFERYVTRLVEYKTLFDSVADLATKLAEQIEQPEMAIPDVARRSIPSEVKREVWRRDEGRCVDCGSRERLEFDHIIPVSRGGANTVRNIELRCERCNRSKGAQI
jgi:hypothetical protein